MIFLSIYLVILMVFMPTMAFKGESPDASTSSPPFKASNLNSIANDPSKSLSLSPAISADKIDSLQGLLNCRNIYWINMPKTTSLFCQTINNICCPSSFETEIDKISIDSIKQNENNEKFISKLILPKQGCSLFKSNPSSKLRKCFNPLFLSSHMPYPKRISDKKYDEYLKLNRTTKLLTYGKRIKVIKETAPIIAVSIFRNPRERLIAAYLDSTSTYFNAPGIEPNDIIELKEALGPNNTQSYAITSDNRNKTLSKLMEEMNTYANNPNIIGCYTKMLNGYNCGSSILAPDIKSGNFNSAFLLKALEVLKSMYFVGIFEQYERSLSLFYRISKSYRQPHYLEMLDKGVSKKPEKQSFLLENWKGYKDPYDDVIYEEALKLFNQMAKLYSI